MPSFCPKSSGWTIQLKLVFMTTMFTSAWPLQVNGQSQQELPADVAQEDSAPVHGVNVADPSTAADDAHQHAKVAFATGLERLVDGHYLEAKELFLQAYRLAPHPVVAYNAALACVALGERERALQLLDEALRHESPTLSTEERTMIARARSTLMSDASDGAPQSPAPPPAPEKGGMPAVDFAQPVRDTVSPSDGSATNTASSARSANVDDRERQNSRLPAGSAAGPIAVGVGAALLVASGVVYYWNDRRHARWERDDTELRQLAATVPSPEGSNEVRRRARENNELLASIQSMDALDLSLAAVGVLGVGVGLYLMLDAGEEVTVGASVGLAGDVSLRVQF